MQRVIIKKTLNYAILNKENQYRHRNNQLLLYVREEKKVRKNRVIKAIYLKFSFLKRQTKLLIAAPTSAVVANIDRAIIYKILSINEYI